MGAEEDGDYGDEDECDIEDEDEEEEEEEEEDEDDLQNIDEDDGDMTVDGQDMIMEAATNIAFSGSNNNQAQDP